MERKHSLTACILLEMFSTVNKHKEDNQNYLRLIKKRKNNIKFMFWLRLTILKNMGWVI